MALIQIETRERITVSDVYLLAAFTLSRFSRFGPAARKKKHAGSPVTMAAVPTYLLQRCSNDSLAPKEKSIARQETAVASALHHPNHAVLYYYISVCCQADALMRQVSLLS